VILHLAIVPLAHGFNGDPASSESKACLGSLGSLLGITFVHCNLLQQASPISLGLQVSVVSQEDWSVAQV